MRHSSYGTFFAEWRGWGQEGTCYLSAASLEPPAHFCSYPRLAGAGRCASCGQVPLCCPQQAPPVGTLAGGLRRTPRPLCSISAPWILNRGFSTRSSRSAAAEILLAVPQAGGALGGRAPVTSASLVFPPTSPEGARVCRHTGMHTQPENLMSLQGPVSRPPSPGQGLVGGSEVWGGRGRQPAGPCLPSCLSLQVARACVLTAWSPTHFPGPRALSLLLPCPGPHPHAHPLSTVPLLRGSGEQLEALGWAEVRPWTSASQASGRLPPGWAGW